MNELAQKTLDESEARELTERLRGALQGVYDLMVEVYQGRAWEALGYSSWVEYCEVEFAQMNLQPAKNDRHEVVMSMREAGMSVRAIGAATELSVGTVQRELSSAEDAGVPNGTRGMDGKTYSAPKRTTKEEVPEVLEGEFVDLDAALDQDAGEFGIEMLTPPAPPSLSATDSLEELEPLMRALSQTSQEGKRALAGGGLAKITHEGLVRETAHAVVTMAGVLDSVNVGAARKSRREVQKALDCAVTTLDKLRQELGEDDDTHV